MLKIGGIKIWRKTITAVGSIKPDEIATPNITDWGFLNLLGNANFRSYCIKGKTSNNYVGRSEGEEY